VRYHSASQKYTLKPIGYDSEFGKIFESKVHFALGTTLKNHCPHGRITCNLFKSLLRPFKGSVQRKPRGLNKKLRQSFGNGSERGAERFFAVSFYFR
jgi:hypothetical protein